MKKYRRVAAVMIIMLLTITQVTPVFVDGSAVNPSEGAEAIMSALGTVAYAETTTSGAIEVPTETYTIDSIDDIKVTKESGGFEAGLPKATVRNASEAVADMDVTYSSSALSDYAKISSSDRFIDFSGETPTGTYAVTVALVDDPEVTTTFNIIIGGAEGSEGSGDYAILPQEDIVVIKQKVDFEVPMPEVVIVDAEGNPVDGDFEPEFSDFFGYTVDEGDGTFIVSKDIPAGTYILPVHMDGNDTVRQEFKIIILEETYTIEMAEDHMVGYKYDDVSDIVISVPSPVVKDAKGDVVPKGIAYSYDSAMNPYLYMVGATIGLRGNVPAGVTYTCRYTLSQDSTIYKEYYVTIEEVTTYGNIENIEISIQEGNQSRLDVSFDYDGDAEQIGYAELKAYPAGYPELTLPNGTYHFEGSYEGSPYLIPALMGAEAGEVVPCKLEIVLHGRDGTEKVVTHAFEYTMPESIIKISDAQITDGVLDCTVESLKDYSGSEMINTENMEVIGEGWLLDLTDLKSIYEETGSNLEDIEDGDVPGATVFAASFSLKGNGEMEIEYLEELYEDRDYYLLMGVGKLAVACPLTAEDKTKETFTLEVADIAGVKMASDFDVKLPNVTVRDSEGEIVEKLLTFEADETLKPYFQWFGWDNTVILSKDIPLGTYGMKVYLSDDESVYESFTLTIKDETTYGNLENVEIIPSEEDYNQIAFSFDYDGDAGQLKWGAVSVYPVGYPELAYGYSNFIVGQAMTLNYLHLFPELIGAESGEAVPYTAELILYGKDGTEKSYPHVFDYVVPEPYMKISNSQIVDGALACKVESILLGDGTEMINTDMMEWLKTAVVVDLTDLKSKYEASGDSLFEFWEDEEIFAAWYELKENGELEFSHGSELMEGREYYFFLVEKGFFRVCPVSAEEKPSETYTLEVADMTVTKGKTDFMVELPDVYVKDSKGELVEKEIDFVADEALDSYILSFNEDGTVTVSKDIPAGAYGATVKLAEDSSVCKAFSITVKEESNNNSGGSSGGSNSGSGSSSSDDDRDDDRNKDDEKDKTKQEPQTETKTEDGQKVAETEVSGDLIETMLKEANKADEENIVIKAEETGDKNITSMSVEDIMAVVKSKKGIEIESDVATVVMGSDALDLEEIMDDLDMGESNAEIKIEVDRVPEDEIMQDIQAMTENEDAQALAAVKIEIKVADDQREKTVEQLDAPITMQVKFDPNQVEDEEKVNLFVKGSDGTLHYVREAHMDMATGLVEFNVNDLSANEYVVLENDVTFADIEDDPQKQYIESVAAKGIVNGRDLNEFMPEGTLTRAEFAVMIVKTLGLATDVEGAESMPFEDVSEDHWGYEYIAIAQENGLIQGFGDGTFKPDQKVNKEQMIQMMVDAFEFENPGDAITGSEENDEFTDDNNISSWAYEAVVKAEDVGLLDGVGEAALEPKEDAERSESTRVVYNLIHILD